MHYNPNFTPTLQVEFAVQLSDATARLKLEESLANVGGIEKVQVHPDSETVVIKSSLPISLLQEKIESAGQRAVIKGYGGTEKGNVTADSVLRVRVNEEDAH